MSNPKDTPDALLAELAAGVTDARHMQIVQLCMEKMGPAIGEARGDCTHGVWLYKADDAATLVRDVFSHVPTAEMRLHFAQDGKPDARLPQAVNDDIASIWSRVQDRADTYLALLVLCGTGDGRQFGFRAAVPLASV
jgi:hypothetical protein